MASTLLRRFAASFFFTSLFLATEVSAALSSGIDDLLGIRGAGVAHIVRVEPGSVAESLSLSPGDLILAFNGRPLKEFSDLGSFTADMRVAATSQKAVLEILKHDPRADSYTDQLVAVLLEESDSMHGLLGIACGFSYVVLEVRATGPGARMGLKRGDFIQEINDRKVGQFHGPAELDSFAREIGAGSPRDISLLLMRWEYPENGKMKGVGARRVTDRLIEDPP